MGDLLKLCLCIYVLFLAFSIVIATIKFVFDVAKWHDKEQRANIIDSVDSSLDAVEPQEDEPTKIDIFSLFGKKESEVNTNGDNNNNSSDC